MVNRSIPEGLSVYYQKKEKDEMATEVFSVKVSDELKSKIKALMDESGMQGQGFMEQVIHIYELNTAKDLLPSAAGDVAELQALTRRMNDIFMSLIERNVNLTADRENTHKQELEEKDKMVAGIQERLNQALTEVERLKNEHENQRLKSQELQEAIQSSEIRIQEQERSYRDLLASREELISEYRGKNDALTGIVSEYQEYKDRNKELATSIERFKAEIEALQKQIREKEQSEVSLRAEMERMGSQHEVALLRVQMEQERTTLALREKHQSRIEELTREHQASIDEYNKRLRELLDQIESIRAGKRALPEST
jgi:chromosome segregation ATPase